MTRLAAFVLAAPRDRAVEQTNRRSIRTARFSALFADVGICSSASWSPISPSDLPWLRAQSLSVSCSRSFAPSAGWKARSKIL